MPGFCKFVNNAAGGMKKVYYFGKALGFFLIAVGIIFGMIHHVKQGAILAVIGLLLNSFTILLRPNGSRLLGPNKWRKNDIGSAWDPLDLDAFWPKRKGK